MAKQKPDKLIDVPDIEELKVGGTRPEKLVFGRTGSKWDPIFAEARSVYPEWVHWDTEIPCGRHDAFNPQCANCKRVSRFNVSRIASSIIAGTLKNKDIFISQRQNEIWIRALSEQDIADGFREKHATP